MTGREADQEGLPHGATARPVGERGVLVGRDAVGTVITTGDNNDVHVTIVVAESSLLAQLRPPTESTGPTFNPYRGLVAFRETDLRWFFGREKLILRAWVAFQVLQRGRDPRILPVLGASGSGKSSLVRAGLLPQLALQPMEELESPVVLVLRPRAAPLHQLAEVLKRLPQARPNIEGELAIPDETGSYTALHEVADARLDKAKSGLVVVVDQFEELFTECKDASAREAFVSNLEFAASHPDRMVSVILTLRSDFAGAVPLASVFGRAVRERALPVQAMARNELTRAIEQPAHELGFPWPLALVERLVDQVEGRAGALPLLQFALQQLWPKHVMGSVDSRGSTQLIEDFLTEAADTLFEAAGGTEGKLSEDQKIIRRAFIAMVQFGEGAEDTRRVARMSELVAAGEDPDYVRAVLGPFIAPETRLITGSEEGDEPTYELTHEALIGAWRRLRRWLGNVSDRTEAERIRSDLRLRRRLTAAAADWKAGRGSLWRPPELDVLLNLLQRTDEDLTGDERKFANASIPHVVTQ